MEMVANGFHGASLFVSSKAIFKTYRTIYCNSGINVLHLYVRNRPTCTVDMNYFWNLLISIDQLVNVLLSPVLSIIFNPVDKFGNPDETLSSVFGKNVQNGSCRACHLICKLLHKFDPNHCKKSIEQ